MSDVEFYERMLGTTSVGEGFEDFRRECEELLWEARRREALKFDWNGHFYNLHPNHLKNFRDHLWFSFTDKLFWESLFPEIPFEFSKEMTAKFKAGEKVSIQGIWNTRCNHCAEVLHFDFDGTTLKFQDPCSHPRGLGEYGTLLDIPSGKIVFGNDFRGGFAKDFEDQEEGWYDWKDIEDIPPGGNRRVFDAWSRLGMAHGYVGNSCPRVLKSLSGDLQIRQVDYDEDTLEDIPIEGLEELGVINTSLWWFSIADYDDLKRRKIPERILEDSIVVDCEPGKYRVRYRYHLSNDRGVFAIVEKVK